MDHLVLCAAVAAIFSAVAATASAVAATTSIPTASPATALDASQLL